MLFFKEITNEQIGMVTEEKNTTDQSQINERLERQWEISVKLTTKNQVLRNQNQQIIMQIDRIKTINNKQNLK